MKPFRCLSRRFFPHKHISFRIIDLVIGKSAKPKDVLWSFIIYFTYWIFLQRCNIQCLKYLTIIILYIFLPWDFLRQSNFSLYFRLRYWLIKKVFRQLTFVDFNGTINIILMIFYLNFLKIFLLIEGIMMAVRRLPNETQFTFF